RVRVARRNPAEIAAFSRSSVFRVEFRLILELGAGLEAVAYALDPRLGIGFRHHLAYFDQDVARARLLDHRRRVAASRLLQLDDVEPGRRGPHDRDVAGLHAWPRPHTQ